MNLIFKTISIQLNKLIYKIVLLDNAQSVRHNLPGTNN